MKEVAWPHASVPDLISYLFRLSFLVESCSFPTHSTAHSKVDLLNSYLFTFVFDREGAVAWPQLFKGWITLSTG